MFYQDFNGLLQNFVDNGRLVREPSGIQCCRDEMFPSSRTIIWSPAHFYSGPSCRVSYTLLLPLIRKISGTALDGGDIDVRMKNWLDWPDKLYLITLIVSTSHSCLRLRSYNPCFHWPYSILGNSFLFMCFASISISTGHPFLTIISSVFTFHFSWYILFSAAGGHELQHVGVLAAELQLRCSVFDDLNTIWVNVREEILQVLLVPHAVKHHGIVHDSKYPFHIYTLFQDFARCLWGIQATICETACVLKFKSSHAAGLGLEHEIISIWLVATRYCIVVFVPNTGCPQPRRMNLNLNLFLFQLASGLRSLYPWRIWFSKVQCFVGNSAFAPASLVSSVVALVGHSFLYFFPLTILPVDFEIPSVCWPPLPRLGLNQRVGDNHCNMFIVFWRKGWLSISIVLSSCCAPRPTNSPNVVIAHSLPITCSLD